jgi:hypothetical protein
LRQLARYAHKDALRFGVLFADGRRATNFGPPDPGAAESPPVALIPRGGGGQPRFWRQEWWLWPLPATGDVTFVCEWPLYEIPERRATLDGDLVREAARRTRPVWS